MKTFDIAPLAESIMTEEEEHISVDELCGKLYNEAYFEDVS